MDLPAPKGTDVILYVAPQVDSDNVVTKVERISDSCKDGRKGGKTVRVGVYIEGQKVGEIAYAHLVPSVGTGDINRWGTRLGTLFSTTDTDPKCWTGPHLHLEMGNVSGYSCFNRGYGPGQAFSETNFIGFVGGNRVSGERKACP